MNTTPLAPQKTGGEERNIKKPRYQSGDEDHDQEVEGTVVFLQDRTNKQNDHKIGYQVGPIGVARHMGKEGDPAAQSPRIKEAPAGNGEPRFFQGVEAQQGLGKEQDQGADKGKTEYCGGVVLDPHDPDYNSPGPA
jgi:hypothetical protein